MSKWCDGFWISAKCTKKQKSCGYKAATCYPSPQGICPTGWHLPTRSEWSKLFRAVGGIDVASKKLKSQVGWDINEYNGKSGDGDNEYGLSIFPSGYYTNLDVLDPTGHSSLSGTSTGCTSSSFWAATDYDSKSAYGFSFINTADYARETHYDKSDGHAVRCIRNAE